MAQRLEVLRRICSVSDTIISWVAALLASAGGKRGVLTPASAPASGVTSVTGPRWRVGREEPRRRVRALRCQRSAESRKPPVRAPRPPYPMPRSAAVVRAAVALSTTCSRRRRRGPMRFYQARTRVGRDHAERRPHQCCAWPPSRRMRGGAHVSPPRGRGHRPASLLGMGRAPPRVTKISRRRRERVSSEVETAKRCERRELIPPPPRCRPASRSG